jgi:hypothetical protein
MPTVISFASVLAELNEIAPGLIQYISGSPGMLFIAYHHRFHFRTHIFRFKITEAHLPH